MKRRHAAAGPGPRWPGAGAHRGDDAWRARARSVRGPTAQRDGQRVDVVLTLTRIAFAGKAGFILVARDITHSGGRRPGRMR